MKSAGSLLKEARLRLNLRYRDVEMASHEIAKRHGNDEFIIALSRLADIENKGTPPSIFRLYSLCAIYRLELPALLGWYGIPTACLPEDSLVCRQPATHLLPAQSKQKPPTAPARVTGTEREISLRTMVRPNSAAKPSASNWLAQSVMGNARKRPLRLGMIGDRDDSMSPILPPGSMVMIDDTRKRIARSGWQSELDRPIYFLETREGYLCRWCMLEGDDLIAIPHPSSNQPPKRFRYPSEIELVGEVIGVTMQRPLVRQSRTRS
ncbi:MAG: S24/S26 family peptidase [Bryobacterales bacterium]|nr:S24/S26 family peptidase [Bryobacterales bacterium]